MVKDKRTIIDSIILIGLFLIFSAASLKRHSANLADTINSDTKGYYSYLPAVFIYKDIHHLPEKEFPYLQKNEKGETYAKYTCGVALFELPFFLVANLYAHIFHFDSSSGLSAPYDYAVIFSGLFWSFVGLYFLKRLLEKYFSWAVTWVTLLCIMLGTNFYCYVTLFNGMSHIYNFALFAAIIFVIDKYYEAPSAGKAMFLGLLMGWIVLTRPTNIVLVLFLVLYRTVTIHDIKERLLFLKKHIAHIFLAIPFFMAIIFLQMLYWKAMTGHWIKYSYEGESFLYWKHPKILEVLFDTQNGLFIYSPILLFLFYGLIVKRKDARVSFAGTSIVFMACTYLFASWWAWTFGGAFGHRCYVDYYPVLAFPFAITIESIVGLRSKIIKAVIFLLLGIFCYYSVAMSELYLVKYTWEGPGWRWNWDGWIGMWREVF